MPISSMQVNQMMAGQQAMFGNNATYAQQISPMGQAMGMAPTYAAPFGPMASPGAASFNAGAAAAPGMLNAAASFGAPMLAGAGMMIGGPVGSMLDPFTAGIRGFGAGVGWQGGAGITANLANVARGGIGGLARGVGMAGLAALPAMGLYHAGRYAFGQMAEGAQFQNQTNAMLQNTFRFTNAQSRTGYGFGQSEQRQIGSMLQQMGTQDMMTTPQELLGIVGRGAQMGMFRGVQDAREFKQKFTQMKDTLTEIAKTFNTTLSEALPFFQQARQQGFWTPQDITRHATQVRQVQANTGMSAQQAQAVMGMGAQMARSIGGTGAQGSEMMARSQMMSGAALFGGVVNERQLAEAGFGTGAEGAQNLGTMLAGASARFARSRVGRWTLAGLMNREGTGLDPAGLRALSTGALSVGEIGRRARRNVSGGRAYDFVMNEGDLRGQLAQAGPEASLGIVRSLVGGRLYGGGGRDRLITRRVIQRFMGGSARQADMIAKMARDMPRMLAVQAARSEGSMDAQERQREQQMQDTYEGFKRRMGHWWDEKVSGPLREAGASISQEVGRTWQRFTDRLFGTTGRGIGMSPEAVRSMVRAAQTGNMSYISEVTGGRDLMGRVLGSDVLSGRTMGMGGARMMADMGYRATGLGQREGGWLAQMFGGPGVRFGRGDIREMQATMRASRGIAGEEEARAIGFGGRSQMMEAMRGGGARQLQEYMQTGEVLALRQRMGGNLDAEQQREYAGRLLERIRTGRAGAQAQQMFQGLGRREAIGRLMAMQGGARGGYTGMGGLGGIGLVGGQDIMTAVEEYQEEATSGLLDALRSGGGGDMAESVRKAAEGMSLSAANLDDLKKDPRGERAMRLFARANAAERDGNMEGAEEHRREARKIMARFANDKSIPEKVRTAAIRLADASDGNAKALAEAAGKVGTGIMAGDRAAFSEKIRMRRSRMREQLRGEGLDRLVRAAGGDRTGLAQALQEAMRDTGTGEGGMVTQKDYVTRMQDLARRAAADPDKAAQMMEQLQQEGLGGTDIGVTLGAALRVSAEAKRFGLKEDIAQGGAISERARRGIRMRLQQLGIKEGDVSKQDVTKLIRGEGVESVRKRLTEQGFKKEDVQKFLGEMRGGMTVEEMREAGARGAGAMGIRTLDEKVAARAGLESGDLHGKLSGRGGSKAIVEQLEVHTQWFQKMNTNLERISRGEEAPKKDKKA